MFQNLTWSKLTADATPRSVRTTKETMDSYQDAMFNRQSFFVVDDGAYDRMLGKLKNGEPFVKSFMNYCPHNKKGGCKCLYTVNILRNEQILRSHKGQTKPVIRLSDVPDHSSCIYPTKGRIVVIDMD